MRQIQGMQNVFASNPALGRVFRFVVTFVAAMPHNFTRQQTWVSFKRNAIGSPFLQSMQGPSGFPKQRYASVHHPSHRWVHPFHGGTRPCRQIRRAVRKLSASGPGIAKRLEELTQLFTRMQGIAVHAFWPSAWPLHGFNPCPWQAKRQIKTAYTQRIVGNGLVQKILKRCKGFKWSQLFQLHAACMQRALGHHNGFALAGAA